MKAATTLMVMGGLVFAGTALASEPAPQQNAQAPAAAGLKIGIDAKTGERRALTEEESAVLDAQASAAKSSVSARSKATTYSPANIQEAMQNTRSVKGIVGFRAPMDSMSSLTVTRNPNGTLTFSENGESLPSPQARESASE